MPKKQLEMENIQESEDKQIKNVKSIKSKTRSEEKIPKKSKKLVELGESQEKVVLKVKTKKSKLTEEQMKELPNTKSKTKIIGTDKENENITSIVKTKSTRKKNSKQDDSKEKIPKEKKSKKDKSKKKIEESDDKNIPVRDEVLSPISIENEGLDMEINNSPDESKTEIETNTKTKNCTNRLSDVLKPSPEQIGELDIIKGAREVADRFKNEQTHNERYNRNSNVNTNGNSNNKQDNHRNNNNKNTNNSSKARFKPINSLRFVNKEMAEPQSYDSNFNYTSNHNNSNHNNNSNDDNNNSNNENGSPQYQRRDPARFKLTMCNRGVNCRMIGCRYSHSIGEMMKYRTTFPKKNKKGPSYNLPRKYVEPFDKTTSVFDGNEQDNDNED